MPTKRHGDMAMKEEIKPRKFKIAKKDIVMLKLLRNNSRLTLTQISKKTNIPISTLYDRLKLLEKNSIVKHTTLIDFAKFGFETTVHFLLKAPGSQRKLLQSYLQQHPQINTVYEVADEFQIFAEGIFENINSAQEFKNHLEEEFRNIESKARFIVKNIKQETFCIGS